MSPPTDSTQAETTNIPSPAEPLAIARPAPCAVAGIARAVQAAGMAEDIVPIYRQMRSEYMVRDAIDKTFYGFIHDTVMDHGETCRLRIDHRIQIGNTMKYYIGDRD